MRVVVAGGTGLVGRALLAELAREPRVVEVVSLARREAPAPHPKVRAPVVDLAALAAADVPDADVAFCCLGTTMKKAGSEEAFRAVDHGLVLRFARACRERGVGAFHVVSATGADPASRVLYNRVKGETERDVRALGFPAACAYRPSLLMADREEERPAERAGILAMRVLGPVVPLRWRGIPPDVVARAMARHALAGDARGWHVHGSGELWGMAGVTAKTSTRF